MANGNDPLHCYFVTYMYMYVWFSYSFIYRYLLSDTTEKGKKCTNSHRSTGEDTATASANYCGPKTQTAKKCKNY